MDANRKHAAGDYVQARSDYQSLLREAEQFDGRDSRVADIHNNLGAHYFDSGRYQEAERHYMLALDAWRRTRGPGSIGFGLTLNNLATLLRVTGRHQDSIARQSEALAIFERAHSAEHVQISMSNLSEAYRAIGDFTNARRMAAQSLELAEALFGTDHPRVAHCLHALGNAQQNGGDTSLARTAYERAIRIREKHLGQNHPLLGATLANLASLYLQEEQLEQSAAAAERAVGILENHFAAGHPNLISAINNLAQVRRAQGLTSAAEPLYRRAIAMSEQVLGAAHPDTAKLNGNLAELLFQLGRMQAAATLFERASETLQASVPRDHPQLATLQAARAVVYFSMRRHTEAEALLRTWLPVMERTLGPEAPRTVQSRRVYESLVQQTARGRSVTPRSFQPTR